jgi:hypothetical protein
MDAGFREHGLRVTWAFTEAGAVGYHGDWPVIGLGPLDGWKKSDVHGGSIDEYLGSIARWMNLWNSWNQRHGGRALPPVLFTSGGTDEWRHFEVQQPNMDAIANFARNWTPLPPPTPEPPPAGDNILLNGSFEGSWYHPGGIAELQIPEWWAFSNKDETTPNPHDPNDWSKFVRPEVRVLSRDFLPPDEWEDFILDGHQTVKIFKDSGAIWATMAQDVNLEDGDHEVTIRVFADLVKDYAEDGAKIWADDPEGRDGLVRVSFSDQILIDWTSLTPGNLNKIMAEFNATGAGTLEVELMCPFALKNNGLFIDHWELQSIEAPPPEPPEPPPDDVIEVVTQIPRGAILTQDILYPDTFDYTVTVNLLPQDVTWDEAYYVVDHTLEDKQDIMLSADGAARLTSLGKEGSVVKVWGADRWSDDIVTWLLDNGAPRVDLLEFPGVEPEPFRIVNIVDELPTHDTKEYLERELSDITHLTIHHTVSPPDRSIASIASFHVNSRDWPGIGYHYVLDDKGGIFETNYLTTKSYHAGSYDAPGDENLYSVGISLQGDFTDEPPPQIQQDAARWLVEVLQDALGELDILGHREMPGASTACPGATYKEWLEEIRR